MPPAARSVVWQAAGSAATLGAALFVSWRFGLRAQGEFGFAKSWFDAAGALAALGLPQGVLHVQYRFGVAPAAMLRWLMRAWINLAVLSLAAAALLLPVAPTLVAAVAASLPFAVGHLVARSLLLAGRGVEMFGAVTALPALLVLAGALGLGLIGQPDRFEGLLLGAALVGGAASMALAWRSAGSPTAEPWSRGALWSASLQSGLQAALGAALAAVLLSVVAWGGRDRAELGAASLGWNLYQVFAVGAGYAAPVIFDRLARRERPATPRWPMAARLTAIALMLVAAAALVAGASYQAWAAWLLPLAAVVPAGLASVGARVAGTVLLARGDYVELSLQALGRLLVAAGVTALALNWVSAALALALALLTIELATWWRCAHVLRRNAS